MPQLPQSSRHSGVPAGPASALIDRPLVSSCAPLSKALCKQPGDAHSARPAYCPPRHGGGRRVVQATDPGSQDVIGSVERAVHLGAAKSRAPQGGGSGGLRSTQHFKDMPTPCFPSSRPLPVLLLLAAAAAPACAIFSLPLHEQAAWRLDNGRGYGNVSLEGFSLPAAALQLLHREGIVGDPLYRWVRDSCSAGHASEVDAAARAVAHANRQPTALRPSLLSPARPLPCMAGMASWSSAGLPGTTGPSRWNSRRRLGCWRRLLWSWSARGWTQVGGCREPRHWGLFKP